MARTIAGELTLPDGTPLANAAIHFTAKRTEAVRILEDVSSFFTTSSTGAYSQDVESGYYAVSVSYAAVPGTQPRRWHLGDVWVEDGDPISLTALLALNNSAADPTDSALRQLLADAQAARDEAQAAAQEAEQYRDETASMLDSKIDESEKGEPGGVATLDSGGRVPAAQLPSYVDDVEEYADYAALPAPGEAGKIYITIDNNRQYRWGGSDYIELVASPGTTDNVPEGSSNLYHTAARVRSVVLSGISFASSAAITASDTILSALGKIQGKLNTLKAMAFLDKASQAQAEAGESDAVGMTPLGVKLYVDQWGLGTFGNSHPEVANVDDAKTAGNFRIPPSALGDHPWPNISSTLYVGVASGSYVEQIAIKGGSSTSSGSMEMAFRHFNGSEWSEWQYTWHSGNLPQSSIDNWNTAYSWGNYVDAGYLTSVSWGDVEGKPAVIAAGATAEEARAAIGAAAEGGGLPHVANTYVRRNGENDAFEAVSAQEVADEVGPLLLAGPYMAYQHIREQRNVYPIDQVTATTNICSTARNQSILSYNGAQYVSYWNNDNELTLYKRDLSTGTVETHTLTSVVTDDRDAHWACPLGIDRDGYLFICYNTRNSNGITWRRSSNPEDITAWGAEQTSMTGSYEDSAGNGKFFNGGETGQPLLFQYRNGTSGDAITVLNEWDETAESWSTLHAPLIDGTGTTPTTSQYIWTLPYHANGDIHLFWCWREPGGVSGNRDICYAMSDDGGATWKKSDGSNYSLPITESSAEVVDSISAGSSLQNYGNATLGHNGDPQVVYFRHDSNAVPQLYRAYLDNGSWIVEQVSNRQSAFSLTQDNATFAPYRMPMGRAGIVVYDDGTPLVFNRDYEYGNTLEFYVKLDGEWRHFVTGSDNLIGADMQWDKKLFAETQVLDLLVHPGSDTTAYVECDFDTPLAIWRFPSLRAALREYPPSIQTIGISARPSDGSYDISESSYKELPGLMSAPFSGLDRTPTHARYIVNVEHTEPDGGWSIDMLTSLDYDDDNGIVWGYAEKSFTGGTARDGSSSRWIDSGWIELPKAGDKGTPRYGAVIIRGKNDSASGTVRFRRYQLMLGYKTV